MDEARIRRRVGRPPGAAPREVRRAQLIEAATHAVRRHGPNASMEAIASEAGVTKPVLYAHFGDRHGLVEAVSDVLVGEVVDSIVREVANASDEEVARTAIRAVVDFMDSEPNLFRFMLAPLGSARYDGNADPKHYATSLEDRISAAVVEGLSPRAAAGGMDEAVLPLIAHAAVGVVYIGAGYWLRSRDLGTDALTDLLTDFVSGGLAAVGLEPTKPPEPPARYVPPEL